MGMYVCLYNIYTRAKLTSLTNLANLRHLANLANLTESSSSKPTGAGGGRSPPLVPVGFEEQDGRFDSQN